NVTPTATPALLVGGRPLPGSVVDGRLTFNVVQGRDVAWTAGLSSDPGATDALGLSYRWSFDDEAERNERDFTRIFAVEGRRTATLTVTDPQGATGAQPFEVNVFVPEPPLCQEVGVLQHSVECAETLVRVEAVSPGGSSLWYDFSWGDGSPTQVVGDPVLGHRYRQSGAYTLRVRVEDQDGIRVDCPPLLLEVANTPPRAALPESGATEEGRPLQLVGSAQDCASDVPLLTFLWDFGDGTPPVSGSAVGEHTYAEPGEYTVTLRVEDDEPLAEGVQPEPGAANVARMVVRVANLPPEASLLAPLPPLAGEGECVQYAACAVDPGGPPAEPLTFTWRWADGSPETIDRGPEPLAGCARNGGEAWPDPCGPCPGQCSLVRRAYPDNLPENRPFLVQLTVADPQGGERSLQLGMVVSNVAPRILQPPQDGGVPPFPATASPGELLLYRFLAAEPGSLDLPLLEWELVEPADWPELGMELERQGAAAGTFRWTPGLTLAEQIFTVTVRVRDKDGATGRFSGRVQVDPGDGDLDGLTDGYELLFPDCLAVGRDDRLLDPDGDGLSNLEEFRRDPGGERSSPCASNAPGAPDPLRPRDGDEEPRGRRDEPPDLDLELLAARAQDPDAAAGYATGRDLPSLHYLFVVGKGLEDPDEGSWQVLASNAAGEMRWHRAPDRDECAQLLDGGPGETVSWRVGREVLQAAAEERGVPLENVTDLQWRVRACDGWGIGSWSAVQTFFYNAVAEPPAACLPLEPPDGAENLSDMPTFVATLANPADPDHDEVACAF
ncbi:MAG: PKD domain-containing protein, partial [Deltaproteobacteria bacterium]|nr:PKD domain-containing protein [Deltaproteobacteria bacterium]